MCVKRFAATSLSLIVVLIGSLFAIPAVTSVSAQSCSPIHSTDMTAWDMSQTRSQGHYEITADGLHIWTESNTSLDKSAGYYPLIVPFSTITGGAIDYQTNLGTIPPGLQIVVDYDGDNVPDGILVGEAIYGANWWLSNAHHPALGAGAPHTGGGNGSNWWGTLAEWSANFPTMQTLALGYSLGSGVHGDYVIRSMTFGCNIFTFGLPTAPVVVSLPDGYICRAMVAASLSGPLYAQALVGQNWSGWDGFVVQDTNKNGGIEISLHRHQGEFDTYHSYRVIGNNGGEMTYLETTNVPGICVEVGDPLASAS